MKDMFSQQIIDELNKDEKVKEFMRMSAQAAERTGVTEQEWNNAKETLMMICIQMCKPAMDILTKEVYETARAR
jgi:pantoate kinase